MDDPVRAGNIARRAAAEGWSVRKVEDVVRQRTDRKEKGKGGRGVPADPVLQALQEELRKSLGTRVVLRRARKGKGVIEVPFLGTEDFERIFALLTGKEASEVVE